MSGASNQSLFRVESTVRPVEALRYLVFLLSDCLIILLRPLRLLQSVTGVRYVLEPFSLVWAPQLGCAFRERVQVCFTPTYL